MSEGWSERLQRVGWWLLLILLPFTSLPFAARLAGSDMVAPASGIILVGILGLWFLPHLIRGGKLPWHVLPLLVFLSAALISMSVAYFLPIPSYRNYNLPRSELKALSTLLVGIGFFVAVSTWAKTTDRLSFVLRWVNWSGVMLIGWSFLQAYLWRRYGNYPGWMQTAQELFSTTRLYMDRVTGFALEPSWLAHQLNMLYLPFWLASAVRGTTVHRLRIGMLTMERVLLIAGLVILVLSVSRIGLLAFLLMVVLLLVLGGIRLVNWMQKKLMHRSMMKGWKLRGERMLVSAGLFVGLIVISAGIFIGAAYWLSRNDPRMHKIFDLEILRTSSFQYYANQLVFAERLVFWQAGWQIFNDHPILGVGLGNSGYFFMEKLSFFSWSLTEVRTLMFQQTALPNIKSLWVRILAETGIAGLACFLAWLYSMWRSADWLRQQSRGLLGTIGLAGLMVLVGMLPEGFSVDTFALPYYWISLGLAAAACTLACVPPEDTRE